MSRKMLINRMNSLRVLYCETNDIKLLTIIRKSLINLNERLLKHPRGEASTFESTKSTVDVLTK